MRFKLTRSVLLALVLIIATPVHAVDGVLEINQACAVHTGCFPGDTAGYPVTITAAGSFRLTSNLDVPNENTNAIVVDANDVGIDLGNFTIQGPVVCSRLPGSMQPLSCTPSSGSGSGIERTSLSILGTSVANGSITGMGSYGLRLGGQSEVTGLQIRWNRLTGISSGSGSTILGNTAYENGDDGISTGEGSTVSANTVYQNGGDGINANANSTISGNTLYRNGGAGIATNWGSKIQRNTVGSNTGFGLLLAAESAYRENVITSNTAGTVTGGVNLGANYCAGAGVITASCP
jgi:parallel beta-helix repeat protein